MSAAELADLSNFFIYSAMFILVLAMVFFALSFSRSRDQVEVDVRERVPVGAGGSAPAQPTQPPAQLSPGRRASGIAMSLSWLALGVLTAGVLVRGLWAGRAPWANMYEFSLASAVAALAIYLLLSLKHDLRWAGVIVIPAVLLTLGLAVTVLYTEAAQLVPALDSYWLIIHVSAAIVCGGAFTLAGLLSIMYLVRDSADKRGGKAFTNHWPSAEKMDTLAYRIVAFTMPLWTFAIVSGAIWAEAAWGRYWGWDPKETWALITWLVFAGYLHARATAGWRGRKAAWLGIAGFATFIFNYFGVNLLLTGLHSYAGV